MSRNKVKLIFVCFLIVILLLPSVSANIIQLNNPFTRINLWIETDTIRDNDLNVNMSLNIYIEKKILNISKNFTIIFYPQDIRDVISRDIQISVCCNISYLNDTISWYNNKKYYEIIINSNTIPFNKNDFEGFIKISYTSPNFIKSDSIDKIIVIGTSCSPKENCPTPNSKAIQKTIILPIDIALRSIYPQDVMYGNDTNVIIFQDFTSTDNQNYDTKTIMYTDLKKEREDKFGWMIYGIILSFIGQLIYDKWKNQKNIKIRKIQL